MRGDDHEPDAMFSYVSTEQRVPRDHCGRSERLVDEVLGDMSREFARLYPRVGHPSIPPERCSARGRTIRMRRSTTPTRACIGGRIRPSRASRISGTC
jgi:hypothetical protein